MTFGKTVQLSEPVSPPGEWAGGMSLAHFAWGPLVVGDAGWHSDQAYCTGDPRGEQLTSSPVLFDSCLSRGKAQGGAGLALMPLKHLLVSFRNREDTDLRL